MDQSELLQRAQANGYRGMIARRDYASAGGASVIWNARDAEHKGENNDCVVRALAVAHPTMDYAEAHALLAKHGRKERKGTYRATSDAAMDEAGGQWALVAGQRRPTLGQFAKANPRGTFVVFMRGHAFALIDGRQVDACANGVRTRLTAAWKFSD